MNDNFYYGMAGEFLEPMEYILQYNSSLFIIRDEIDYSWANKKSLCKNKDSMKIVVAD